MYSVVYILYIICTIYSCVVWHHVYYVLYVLCVCGMYRMCYVCYGWCYKRYIQYI